MGQRHVCTFRHAQRAAYRTAISAAQILVIIIIIWILYVKKVLMPTEWHFFSQNVNISEARSTYVVSYL